MAPPDVPGWIYTLEGLSILLGIGQVGAAAYALVVRAARRAGVGLSDEMGGATFDWSWWRIGVGGVAGIGTALYVLIQLLVTVTWSGELATVDPGYVLGYAGLLVALALLQAGIMRWRRLVQHPQRGARLGAALFVFAALSVSLMLSTPPRQPEAPPPPPPLPPKLQKQVDPFLRGDK